MQKIFNKVMIIDGSYQLHRNLHVEEIANLRTSTGVKSGGVFGFLRSLNYAMKNCPSDYFPIICWDSRVSQRRLDLYPNYKRSLDREKDREYTKVGKLLIEDPSSVDIAKYDDNEFSEIQSKVSDLLAIRDKFGTFDDPDDYLSNYVSQRNLVIDVCNALGIPNIKYQNWEGDDLMTLLTRVSNKSVIVSDDSDMRQLISPDVEILRVLKGIQKLDMNTIVNDGYPNAHILAVIKAIVGDASDNVPQVAFRLGVKTAEKLALIMYKNDYDENKYIPEIKELLKGSVIDRFIDNHSDFVRNLKLVDLSYVEDDYDVYNHISTVVKESSTDYLNAVGQLSKLEINSVDIDSIVSRVVVARDSLYGV